MLSLLEMLAQRTHRDLELIARAHNVPFTRRIPKAKGLAKLSADLLMGAYREAFFSLTTPEIEALQALVIGGGWLPLPLFKSYYGQIRLYRPWRKDFSPRHPWRNAISVAERLYHLGFIHIRDGCMVGIIGDIADLLPPVNTIPSVVAMPASPVAIKNNPSILLRDLSVLIGILLREDVRAVHGRWLPLSCLRTLNQYVWIPENLTDVRSEHQAGRVRWLHYLAEVAGLVSVQNGYWQPTVAAWEWLSAPPDVKVDSLMLAVERDLSARDPVWHHYRLPEIDLKTWSTLRHLIASLDPAYTYRIRDILTTLRPYLLRSSAYDIALTLRDCFAWSGILVYQRGQVYVNQREFSNAQAAQLIGGDKILLRLPPLTNLHAFADLHSFADIEGHYALVDEISVRQAVAIGFDAAGIISTLTALIDEPLPVAWMQNINEMVQAAKGLQLRQVMLLDSDEGTIQRIHKDWRLREFITEKVSPTHLAIAADKAHTFIKRLKQRNLPVTTRITAPQAPSITQNLNADMADYLLLALHTYQGLHSRLGAGVRIPKALTHWLAGQVDNPNNAYQQAQDLIAAVQQITPDPIGIPMDDSLQDEASIRRAIERAYRNNQPITIDYYSPWYDETSTRTIDVMLIWDDNDLTYIDAYCHRDHDERQFRMDRILRVRDIGARADVG